MLPSRLLGQTDLPEYCQVFNHGLSDVRGLKLALVVDSFLQILLTIEAKMRL